VRNPARQSSRFTSKPATPAQQLLIPKSEQESQSQRSRFYHTYAPEVTLVSLLLTETVVWIKTKSASDRFGFYQFT